MSQSTSRSRSASDVLGPILRQQVGVFRTREALLRLDEPDAAHRFMVSVRRLRSLVTAFGTLLDAKTCAELEAELRDTARIVGGARDAQAVRRRLESLLSEEPDSEAVGQVDKRLTVLVERSYRQSWQETITHFDSPGYDTLTRTLEGFADLPPWTPAAEGPAGQVFVPALRQEWARLLSRGRSVQGLKAGPERDRGLQAVHGIAKRAKDVAEAQEAISGRKVERLRKVAGGLATTLGEYQSLVLTGELLDGITPELERADRVVQRLRHRETAAADELYARFDKGFREADRKPLWAWMS